MPFSIGSTWRTQATFRSAGAATDPTTITLKVRDPAGTETPYTYALSQVTRSGVGVYYKDLTTNASGRWIARWIGTGTVPEADEESIEVAPSMFTTP